ncbi:BTB/POZ domain-containing protein At3g22104 isoform X2 [Cornus florida]|nr:BTB/POZ domain-containing protein At3g22104 isoform X2 [Cornus florida]XP_059661954.1 BTB/POZ domain-containing protein At3g22104 isoform X2 [Cornus florida]XP_059661955.1 BTB/POZ domain-containing protein At3g22104 isoform X2 [Cornus florida]XP_059661956.1 BTB/POZ domain-containing protein At3g22104 isoform X2 [Cornus florida]XP_059661957.1 BTB/POZ domain-containing protein At3g22104 isoform X2 [Cornus florida]XP_059661958.1 BTB/POZ domain-containing protein At3g22104 isoform X2 [Cornus fl
MTKFCYNNAKIEINPFNLSLLYCIAHFMEMDKSISGTVNLFEQTEKSLKEIRYWTWSELLVALKQCQELLPVSNSLGILQKCLDSLVGRLALSNETSPCPSTSSPDSSGLRFSCDTRSTESFKNSFFRTTWWFEDLVTLHPDLIEMVIKSLVSRKFDHSIISRFLFYYQKSRFITATSDEKCKITEAVIDMLYSLDQATVSYKNLFGILRVALTLNIRKCCRNNLESMIGSQMDQATLDNLLVPSPIRTNYLYDVNLVLRLLRSFLDRGICPVPLVRSKKVASLMDLYIAEVAPDPNLKPSKFLALISVLPDSARDTYDGIYHAMDMYLEVHSGLSEEEKMNICCGLNYKKLSSEVCSHLARNTKFPSKSAVQALVSQQSVLKSLLQETNQPNPFIDSPCSFVEIDSTGNEKACEQIVLYAGKLDLSSENENLRAHLQGMQWRVQELEKVCRKMQARMTKIMKSRLSSHSNARSLPRLCS